MKKWVLYKMSDDGEIMLYWNHILRKWETSIEKATTYSRIPPKEIFPDRDIGDLNWCEV